MSNAASRDFPRNNVLWRLHREGHNAECVIEGIPAGLRAHFLIDGLLLVTYQFGDHSQVLTWALEKCSELESRGWLTEDFQVRQSGRPRLSLSSVA